MLKSKKFILVLLGVFLLAFTLTGCFSQESEELTGEETEQAINNDGLGAGSLRQSAAPISQSAKERPLFVEIISATSPVSPGGMPVTLFAKTKPGAICEIKVGYKAGAGEEKELFPKQAEGNGFVSWTWVVDPSVDFGKYTVTVTAKSFDGQTATSEKDIEVKPEEECDK